MILKTFTRLESRLRTGRTRLVEHADALGHNDDLRSAIDESIARHSVTLLKEQ
jgi:hypothetical protein